MQELWLLGTSGCHLCSVAGDVVARAMDRCPQGVRVLEKDIADANALVELYGIRIPVLRNDALDIELDWPFTEEQVVALFNHE